MQLKLYHTHVLPFLYLAVQSGIAFATPDEATVVSTVVITSYAPQPTPARSYTSETLFEDTVLNVTNRYRAQHDASALTWNNSLTAYAENWAKKCLWKHSVRAACFFPLCHLIHEKTPRFSSILQ